jgi:GNAT superfamily N-acetyltransferase
MGAVESIGMITPVQVMMLRPSLDDFPQYSLPRPFTIRWYQAGDERHWLAMKACSDQFHHADLTYYRSTYGAHAHLLPERQAFLCDGAGQPIGTTTAWFEDFAGQQYAKVNWVFIVPEAQGQGLAKPLLSVIGQRLRLLGHTRALLYTLATRMPAIHLYQHFGFVPCVRHAAEVRAWDEINQHLRVPFRANQVIEMTTT